MSPPTRLRTLARLLLIAAAAAVLFWLIVRGLGETQNPFADFYDFYWAADAARKGTDIFSSGDRGYVYPPLLAVLLMPLSLLEPQPAMRVWIITCAALLVWCVWRSVKLASDAINSPTERSATWALASIVLLILFDSFRAEFQWANCNIPMMTAIILGFAWLRTKPALGGTALAFACSIKYMPLAFLPYLLVRRQWKAAAGMVAGLIACVLLPALWLGWTKNLEYLTTALRGMGIMSGATGASGITQPAANVIPIDAEYSLSITSGIARMLGPDRSFSSLALWTTAALALAVMVAWTLYRTKSVGFFTPHAHYAELKSASQSLAVSPRKKTQTTFTMLWFAEFCAVLAAALAFAPQTQKRHFNLLVPLIAGLIVVVAKLPGKARIICIAALLAFAAGVTPMPNIPGLRTFIDVVWKWGGGPGWLVIAVSYAFIWIALSRPTPRTSDHA